MADNTDEEHLENLKNTQSENPLDEISPANEKETFNPNQVTDDTRKFRLKLTSICFKK